MGSPEPRKSFISMVAVCLFLVYSFSGDSAVASAEEIIPMAFHLKKGTVTLTGPVTVEQVSVFRDGGTIGVRLKDESGTRLDFCLDHRIRSTFEAGKPYHMFVGGLHPGTLNEIGRASCRERVYVLV